MAASHGNLLAIGDLADRTGVPAATLRSWEARYGFPHPVRLAGGHRRYTEPDIDAVLDVLRLRRAGYAMDAAVRLTESGGHRPRSVYAELRRQHPELISQPLTKATLVALSHAIEDECAARAQEPLLFGGFQRPAFLRSSYARWVELARTAQVAVVFADLSSAADPQPGMPVEVALPRQSALQREWFVVCDAPDLPACLAAVERPGQRESHDVRRRFEAVWTVDPRAVRHASRIAAALAEEYRPGWRAAGLPLLADEPAEASADLHRMAELMHRMVGYLDSGS